MFSNVHIRYLALGLLVALAACVAASCGLLDAFSVRESEDPTGTETEYVLPQEPEQVITNLISAVNFRDVVNYESILAEDFVFEPDPRDALTLENYYPGVFDGWDIEVEKEVARRMFDQGGATFALLRFDEDSKQVSVDTDSSYVVQEDYTLITKLEKLETFTGTAIFSLKRLSDGLWYMEKWEDSRPEGEGQYDTWGILKGEIRATK
jgi:hypothetical protein